METTITLPAEWGKDHYSLLAYCEIRATEHRGLLNTNHLRVNQTKRGYTNGVRSIDSGWKASYGTQWKDGITDPEHDDLDVLEELENAGLVENTGTEVNPSVKLTSQGLTVAFEVRKHLAGGGKFSTFQTA